MNLFDKYIAPRIFFTIGEIVDIYSHGYIHHCIIAQVKPEEGLLISIEGNRYLDETFNLMNNRISMEDLDYYLEQYAREPEEVWVEGKSNVTITNKGGRFFE